MYLIITLSVRLMDITKRLQPTFFAIGPDILTGVEIDRRPTAGEAPPYARILGVEMPWADGKVIDEILQ